MSDHEDDDLRGLMDALRAEYDRELPNGGDPPEALLDCDEPTRRAVGWLRECWDAEVEADAGIPLTPPIAVARAARRWARPDTRRSGWPRLAAGALVAAAAAALVLPMLRTGNEHGDEETDGAPTIAARLDPPSDLLSGPPADPFSGPPTGPPTGRPLNATSDSANAGVATTGPSADGPITAEAPATPNTSQDFSTAEFRSRDDGVELVQGSVRIVLLTQNQ